MYRTLLVPALFTALLGSGAFAANDSLVREIVVEIDLDEVTNPAAAARYATITADLQSALATRLEGRMAPEGMRMTIDISELELSNSFQETLGLADTKLVADVHLTDVAGTTSLTSYQLTVNIEQAKTFFPPEVDLATMTASSDAYYIAMVEAFATAVVERLDR